MKLNATKTSSARKMRKAHFGATSVERARRMSAPLSRDLRAKYQVRSMPLRRDDEVIVVRGHDKRKSTGEGKVTAVYRKKYVIHVERVTKEKTNGQNVPISVQPSNVIITRLKMDKSRKQMLERKKRDKNGSFTDGGNINNMAGVD